MKFFCPAACCPLLNRVLSCPRVGPPPLSTTIYALIILLQVVLLILIATACVLVAKPWHTHYSWAAANNGGDSGGDGGAGGFAQRSLSSSTVHNASNSCGKFSIAQAKQPPSLLHRVFSSVAHCVSLGGLGSGMRVLHDGLQGSSAGQSSTS